MLVQCDPLTCVFHILRILSDFIIGSKGLLRSFESSYFVSLKKSLEKWRIHEWRGFGLLNKWTRPGQTVLLTLCPRRAKLSPDLTTKWGSKTPGRWGQSTDLGARAGFPAFPHLGLGRVLCCVKGASHLPSDRFPGRPATKVPWNAGSHVILCFCFFKVSFSFPPLLLKSTYQFVVEWHSPHIKVKSPLFWPETAGRTVEFLREASPDGRSDGGTAGWSRVFWLGHVLFLP